MLVFFNFAYLLFNWKCLNLENLNQTLKYKQKKHSSMKQNHYNQSFEKNDIIHAATMKKVLLIILLFTFAIQSQSMPSFKDTILVSSIVKDEFTGDIIGNAAIRVYDEQNNLIAQGTTSSQPSMNNNQLANFTLFLNSATL